MGTVGDRSSSCAAVAEIVHSRQETPGTVFPPYQEGKVHQPVLFLASRFSAVYAHFTRVFDRIHGLDDFFGAFYGLFQARCPARASHIASIVSQGFGKVPREVLNPLRGSRDVCHGLAEVCPRHFVLVKLEKSFFKPSQQCSQGRNRGAYFSFVIHHHFVEVTRQPGQALRQDLDLVSGFPSKMAHLFTGVLDPSHRSAAFADKFRQTIQRGGQFLLAPRIPEYFVEMAEGLFQHFQVYAQLFKNGIEIRGSLSDKLFPG